MGRLIGSMLAATIALIVVLAMPSVASAHPGHHDAGAKASTVESSKAAPAAAQERSAAQTRYVEAAKAPSPALPCDGATCCGKACAACGFVLLGSPITIEPHWVSLAAPALQSRPLAATRPDDLVRPPRTLAQI